jgi:branched-chain amino acid transport system ATP-binding protein
MLTATNLVKRFGGVAAVDEINIAVEPGERRVIIGPNGAGKTTLFDLLSGTLTPDAGTIEFLGQQIAGLRPYRRASLGIARTFQVTSLLSSLTVMENAVLAVQSGQPYCWSPYVPLRYREEWQARAKALLSGWGLADLAAVEVRNLSHGAHRQLEIVLALAHEPRLLLLDEPTQGLSPSETELAARAIAGISRNTTIVIIEHDLAVAFALADRVTVMHQGKVLVEGTPAEIQGNEEVTRIYFGLDDEEAP